MSLGQQAIISSTLWRIIAIIQIYLEKFYSMK